MRWFHAVSESGVALRLPPQSKTGTGFFEWSNHMPAVTDRRCMGPYALAVAAFCRVTWDAPMAGRSPLCHHSTNTLAMKMDE